MIVDLKASLLGIEGSSTYAGFPVYNSGTNQTSIVADLTIFNSGMVGMAFYPDSTSRNAYEIVGFVSSTNIIVAGNVKGIEDTNTTMQVCRRGIITEESGRVLLDVDAAFTSPMAGWRVELNLEKPAILNLGGYVSGSKMQLQGDPLFLADLRTERYHIAAPPGVCGPNTGTSYSATGATADPRDRNKANASNPGSRYLWAGYMYLTPIVGVWNGSSIQGSQSGINKLGQYYCLNRTYDIATGRFTSPDPAASPFWNLFDYCHNQPTQLTDPTGLAFVNFDGFANQGSPGPFDPKKALLPDCGGFHFELKFSIDQTSSAWTSGYRLFQFVNIHREYTCCDDTTLIEQNTSYIEVWDFSPITDTQRNAQVPADADDACSKAGRGRKKTYRETRHILGGLGKPTQRAANLLALRAQKGLSAFVAVDLTSSLPNPATQRPLESKIPIWSGKTLGDLLQKGTFSPMYHWSMEFNASWDCASPWACKGSSMSMNFLPFPFGLTSGVGRATSPAKGLPGFSAKQP